MKFTNFPKFLKEKEIRRGGGERKDKKLVRKFSIQ